MSLDDERTPWPAAEAIERGEDPQLPETAAARRIGSLLAQHLHTPYLTPDFFAAIGAKCIANRQVIGAVFAEVDADPKRLPDRGKVLRQQATSSLSDEDHVLERLHHLKAEESYLNSVLAAMGSVYAPKLRDADEAAEDAEDRRLAEQRHDQHAAENAPTGIAS